jgi:hypothetical protein
MRAILGMGLALALAAPALAEDVPVETSKMSGQAITLHLYPFLTETDLKTLRFVASNEQALAYFITTKGYSAIAVAPDAGFAPGGAPAPTTIAIGDLPDAAAASEAAIKGCEEKREGGADCVVILEVGPDK